MNWLLKRILLTCFVTCLIAAATFREKDQIGVTETLAHFRIDSKAFAKALLDLGRALEDIDSTKPETVLLAKQALTDSRVAYKRIEYFLEYFFFTSSRIYNRAPKNEIEEPFLEYQAPAGFQYIEAMLFDSLPESHKDEYKEQIRLLSVSANDMNSLLYKFECSDNQFLESARIQLVRIMTLGITGFDTPLLKTGILESKSSLQSIENVIAPFIKSDKSQGDSVRYYLESSLKYLDQNPDFDSFDRMDFLTLHAMPLQEHLGKMIRNLNLESNKYGVMNYDAKNIFSNNSFNSHSFPGNRRSVSNEEIELGKTLFFDTNLSGNAQRSCASCHNPSNYFTDGLAKSIGFEDNTFAKRNAPSLFYSGFQHNLFWDGRTKTLEEQIENVIKDPTEMNGNGASFLKKINADRSYRKFFQKSFAKKRREKINEQEIYNALGSYVRTLNPYNSPFDAYMKGDKRALTDSQVAGFNLFMGKAQCGTCHFAPLFNGLIPPFYKLTEFEILGTTSNDDLTKPQMDPDEGRFTFRKTPFYKNAFKTPTIRNSAKTAPYMHNGAFQTLETLVEFYNRGGGAGLGLDFPNQTLSSVKLNLTEKEKKEIIDFLGALTDRPDSN